MFGTVVKFDDEKKFGFIRPDNKSGEKDLFFHLNDVFGKVALSEGQRVSFKVEEGDRGPVAKHIEPGEKRSSPYFVFGSVGALITLTCIVGLWYLKISWGLAYLCGVNVAVFFLYFYDKKAAGGSGTRVPEAILHLFTLLGGTPAAYAGQTNFAS